MIRTRAVCPNLISSTVLTSTITNTSDYQINAVAMIRLNYFAGIGISITP